MKHAVSKLKKASRRVRTVSGSCPDQEPALRRSKRRRVLVCGTCGWVSNIPKKKWEQLPPEWVCPDCRACERSGFEDEWA